MSLPDDGLRMRIWIRLFLGNWRGRQLEEERAVTAIGSLSLQFDH